MLINEEGECDFYNITNEVFQNFKISRDIIKPRIHIYVRKIKRNPFSNYGIQIVSELLLYWEGTLPGLCAGIGCIDREI